MSTMTSSWTDMVYLPDEHRIFKATEECLRRSLPRSLKGWPGIIEFGGWAIADRSGEWPEHTDDGILWLNFAKTIMVANDTKSPHLPVMSPDGSEYTTVTNVASLLILTDLFRWTMNVDGKIYRTVRW